MDKERESAAILGLLASLASVVVPMFDEFIRLREAVLADDSARERYSVGFGEKRFLDLQQKAHELLELIRQTEKEVSPD
jgi:hypothetical protein